MCVPCSWVMTSKTFARLILKRTEYVLWWWLERLARLVEKPVRSPDLKQSTFTFQENLSCDGQPAYGRMRIHGRARNPVLDAWTVPCYVCCPEIRARSLITNVHHLLFLIHILGLFGLLPRQTCLARHRSQVFNSRSWVRSMCLDLGGELPATARSLLTRSPIRNHKHPNPK